ncbi:MAG: hypothetical protein ACFE9T_03130 [Promethearchaeota archaeon]
MVVKEMDYNNTFLEALHYLATTYRKFPKFMIEIIAENYGIPHTKIKELIYKFRKEGILIIVKDEGYTFTLENK